MAPIIEPTGYDVRIAPRPKYLAIALTAVQRALAYRGTTLLNMLSQLISLAVLFYLWRTVYGTRSQLAGFTWQEMRTYIVVAFAVDALITFYSLLQITNTIRTGDIANELIRPVDYLGLQLAQTFGAALIEGLLGGALALLVGVFLLDVSAPPGAPAALLFMVSVWLGFLIRFLVNFLVALLCFRTLNAVGLIWAETAVLSLLSGALIPLHFFPDWLRTIVLALPFGGIVYTPAMIYLGKAQGAALWWALAVQLAWVAILWALARLLWRPSVRALEIQGG